MPRMSASPRDRAREPGSGSAGVCSASILVTARADGLESPARASENGSRRLIARRLVKRVADLGVQVEIEAGA